MTVKIKSSRSRSLRPHYIWLHTTIILCQTTTAVSTHTVWFPHPACQSQNFRGHFPGSTFSSPARSPRMHSGTVWVINCGPHFRRQFTILYSHTIIAYLSFRIINSSTHVPYCFSSHLYVLPNFPHVLVHIASTHWSCR